MMNLQGVSPSLACRPAQHWIRAARSTTTNYEGFDAAPCRPHAAVTDSALPPPPGAWPQPATPRFQPRRKHVHHIGLDRLLFRPGQGTRVPPASVLYVRDMLDREVYRTKVSVPDLTILPKYIPHVFGLAMRPRSRQRARWCADHPGRSSRLTHMIVPLIESGTMQMSITNNLAMGLWESAMVFARAVLAHMRWQQCHTMETVAGPSRVGRNFVDFAQSLACSRWSCGNKQNT